MSKFNTCFSIDFFLKKVAKFNARCSILVQIILEQHLVVLKISETTSCGPENFWNNILWSCSILKQHFVVLFNSGTTSCGPDRIWIGLWGGRTLGLRIWISCSLHMRDQTFLFPPHLPAPSPDQFWNNISRP